MTVNDVKESLKNSGRHVSMDAPLVEGEDSNLYDVLNSGESPNPDRQLLHESLSLPLTAQSPGATFCLSVSLSKLLSSLSADRSRKRKVPFLLRQE